MLCGDAGRVSGVVESKPRGRQPRGAGDPAATHRPM